MAVTFLEPGGDATFNVATPTTNGLWGAVNGTTPTVATDFVHGTHQKSIKYSTGAASYLHSPNGVIADAGGRISFYIYFNALPTTTKAHITAITTSGGGTSIVRLYLTTAGILQLWRGAAVAQIGSNGSTLSTGTWYQISIAYTITSSTVNEFRVYLNGNLDITVSNDTLATTASSVMRVGNFDANAMDIRTSDHYCDNSSSLSHPGNIWVTAKRPKANGTLNEFTTQVGAGGSGYGTGHSPQVNERAISTTNAWSISNTTRKTEEYTIESKSEGDIDITNYTIVDSLGWISAKVDSTLNTPVHRIIVNGTTTSKTMTTSDAIYSAFIGSSTYPSGNTDIGMDAQYSTTPHTTTLNECGLIVAAIVTVVKTITGKADIKKSATQTITGKASIVLPPAKELLIAGVDYTTKYITNTPSITEIIQNKSNKFQIQLAIKRGETLPREGSEITFKAQSRHLFGGFISKIEPEETGIGDLFTCSVEASDYSYIFNNKVARRSYTNQTLSYIVNDLMDTYVDSSYGFSTINVATGPTIASINFDHINIRKCFEKLSKATGYVWWVDYEKYLYFQDISSTPAPEDIRDGGTNHESLKISYDTSQVRNSVIVIGNLDGEESDNTSVETFTGDGVTRSWELADKPSTVVTIKLNGVSKQFSLDVNERSTDYFVYSFEGKSFRLTDASSTPVGGGSPDSIEITYYPRVPIIVQEIDSDSIAFFSALDGGDGYMEYSIKDTTIYSKEEATDRALQELDQYANPLVDGRFRTRTSLLQSGSIFQAGQYVVINSPVNNINTDTAFLIQEVRITMVEDKNGTTDNTEYIYDVRFGGRVVGIQEFLEGLASDEGDVTDADIILTLESTTDLVVFDDDPATTSLATPPFDWGSGGAIQGKWNMSEWS